MTPKDWRRNRAGCLHRTLKAPGASVRLFEKRPGKGFTRAVWEPDARRWNRKALGTTCPAEALRLGKLLLGNLLAGARPGGDSGPVTFGELWERYAATAQAMKTDTPRGQERRMDASNKVAHLLAFFGERCDVRHLSADDVAAYAAARRSGGLPLPNGERSRVVRARAVTADLATLTTMLRWAVTVRTTAGQRWLAENPLAGIKRPSDPNPRRPVASEQRFNATREAMQRLAEQAGTEAERVRWWKLEAALVLAEATGRRLGAIRGLGWDDVLFPAARIRWRAEFDKQGRDWVTEAPPAVFDFLRTFQRRLGAVGGWLFAGERKPDQPMDRHLFDRWLAVAERDAGVPKLDGSLWHAYRRAWATARKHHAPVDVAAVGGWTNTRCLLDLYTRADPEGMRAVVLEQRKVREA